MQTAAWPACTGCSSTSTCSARPTPLWSIAGMEGALASLVGGLTPAPLVAVPTSAGYGASLEGVTALAGDVGELRPGLCVVGIDNGFGAAWAVARILGKRKRGLDGAGHDGALVAH